jgi:hypothetical protein
MASDNRGGVLEGRNGISVPERNRLCLFLADSKICCATALLAATSQVLASFESLLIFVDSIRGCRSVESLIAAFSDFDHRLIFGHQELDG